MDAHLQEIRIQYKSDYDRRGRRTFFSCSGVFVFIGRTPLSEMKSGIADNIVKTVYSKLLPRSLGSFCITAVNSPFRVIDKYGVHKTVSIDRVTHTPRRANPTTGETPMHPGCQCANGNTSTRDRNMNTNSAEQKPTQKRTSEYTVDKLIQRTGSGRNIKYGN